MNKKILVMLGLMISLAIWIQADNASCTGSVACPDVPECNLINKTASCGLSLSTGERCEVWPGTTEVTCKVFNAKGQMTKWMKSECTVCLSNPPGGGGSGGGGGTGTCQAWDCLTGPMDQSGWCPIWYINCGI